MYSHHHIITIISLKTVEYIVHFEYIEVHFFTAKHPPSSAPARQLFAVKIMVNLAWFGLFKSNCSWNPQGGACFQCEDIYSHHIELR